VRANGYPIGDHSYLKSPLTVTYSAAFEREEARIAAGLTREQFEALPGDPQWVDPNNPTLSKAEVLVYYRMHNVIRSVAEDVRAREMNRKRRH